jgi:2-phospho-L-lactate guanylyltransferase
MSAPDTSATEAIAAPSRIAAIIPVGTLEGAKSRLGETLDAEERQDLAERLLARTVAAALAVERLADVLVISPDREVLQRAARHGARTLRQRTLGLNAGLAEARADVIAGGADAILILPIDLAFVSAEALAALLDPLSRPDAVSAVVLVTDRHGTGTNALALRPPEVIEFAFGPGSRRTHRETADAAGARYTEVGGPLVFDIDTAADLIVVDSIAPEEIGAG